MSVLLIASLITFTYSKFKLQLIHQCFLHILSWFFFFGRFLIISSLIVPSLIIPSLTPHIYMGNSTRAKAAKSPKKPHAESSQTGSKRNGHTRRKPVTTTTDGAQKSETSNNDVEEPGLKVPACVVWDKYPERTECLLNYLDAHPDVAIKLFRDSTQAAKLEGCSKLTAKLNKTAGYLQVADEIFSVDENLVVQADFTINPNKYAKALNNYITNT